MPTHEEILELERQVRENRRVVIDEIVSRNHDRLTNNKARNDLRDYVQRLLSGSTPKPQDPVKKIIAQIAEQAVDEYLDERLRSEPWLKVLIEARIEKRRRPTDQPKAPPSDAIDDDIPF
jgi:vacuolar-type H+-ATPase subunit E/Vma4